VIGLDWDGCGGGVQGTNVGRKNKKPGVGTRFQTKTYSTKAHGRYKKTRFDRNPRPWNRCRGDSKIQKNTEAQKGELPKTILTTHSKHMGTHIGGGQEFFGGNKGGVASITETKRRQRRVITFDGGGEKRDGEGGLI